jgi:quercetin dioxygenase-like cupin family protein
LEGSFLGFKAIHYEKVSVSQVKEVGAEGVQVRWLINKENDGAENFAMRLFEIAPSGHTPTHSHEWEHEVYVLEGNGIVFCEGSEKQLKPGYVVFVPPNSMHNFRNNGKQTLRFLCLIPYS